MMQRGFFEAFQLRLTQAELGPRNPCWFSELSAAATASRSPDCAGELGEPRGNILSPVDDEHPYRNQLTPQRIAQSLGVEDNPEMSWTSSMHSIPCCLLSSGPEATDSLSSMWPHLQGQDESLRPVAEKNTRDRVARCLFNWQSSGSEYAPLSSKKNLSSNGVAQDEKKIKIQLLVSKTMEPGDCSSQLCAIDESEELLLKPDETSQIVSRSRDIDSNSKLESSQVYEEASELNKTGMDIFSSDSLLPESPPGNITQDCHMLMDGLASIGRDLAKSEDFAHPNSDPQTNYADCELSSRKELSVSQKMKNYSETVDALHQAAANTPTRHYSQYGPGFVITPTRVDDDAISEAVADSVREVKLESESVTDLNVIDSAIDINQSLQKLNTSISNIKNVTDNAIHHTTLANIDFQNEPCDSCIKITDKKAVDDNSDNDDSKLDTSPTGFVLMHLSLPKSQKTANCPADSETNVHVKESQERLEQDKNYFLQSQMGNAKLKSKNNKEPAPEATSSVDPMTKLETFTLIAETPKRAPRLGVFLSGAQGALGADARSGSANSFLLSSLGRRKSKFIYSVQSNENQISSSTLIETTMGRCDSFLAMEHQQIPKDEATPCNNQAANESSDIFNNFMHEKKITAEQSTARGAYSHLKECGVSPVVCTKKVSTPALCMETLSIHSGICNFSTPNSDKKLSIRAAKKKMLFSQRLPATEALLLERKSDLDSQLPGTSSRPSSGIFTTVATAGVSQSNEQLLSYVTLGCERGADGVSLLYPCSRSEMTGGDGLNPQEMQPNAEHFKFSCSEHMSDDSLIVAVDMCMDAEHSAVHDADSDEAVAAVENETPAGCEACSRVVSAAPCERPSSLCGEMDEKYVGERSHGDNSASEEVQGLLLPTHAIAESNKPINMLSGLNERSTIVIASTSPCLKIDSPKLSMTTVNNVDLPGFETALLLNFEGHKKHGTTSSLEHVLNIKENVPVDKRIWAIPKANDSHLFPMTMLKELQKATTKPNAVFTTETENTNFIVADADDEPQYPTGLLPTEQPCHEINTCINHHSNSVSSATQGHDIPETCRHVPTTTILPGLPASLSNNGVYTAIAHGRIGATDISTVYSGFHTASRKPIPVSDDEMQKAKHIFKDIENISWTKESSIDVQNVEVTKLSYSKTCSSNFPTISNDDTVTHNFKPEQKPNTLYKRLEKVIPNDSIITRKQVELTESQSAEVEAISNMAFTDSQFAFTQVCMPADPTCTSDRLYHQDGAAAQDILPSGAADAHQTDTFPEEQLCRQEVNGLESPPKESLLSKQSLQLVTDLKDPIELQSAYKSRFKVSAWKPDSTLSAANDVACDVNIKRYNADFDVQFTQVSALQTSFLKHKNLVQPYVQHQLVSAGGLSKVYSVSCEDVKIDNYPDNVPKELLANNIASTGRDQGQNQLNTTICQEKKDKGQSNAMHSMNQGGFHTAAGQKIVLSESAIHKGRNIFEDIYLDNITQAKDILLQTSTSYNIDCTVENNVAHQKISSRGSTDKQVEPSLGLSVASGKITNAGMLPLQNNKGFNSHSDLSFSNKYQSSKTKHLNVKLNTISNISCSSGNVTVANNFIVTEPPCLTHDQAASSNTCVLNTLPNKERSQLFGNANIQSIDKRGENMPADGIPSEHKPSMNTQHAELNLHRKSRLANGGFQTASGKKVTINDDSLKRAKTLFEEFNVTVEGSEDICRVNVRDDNLPAHTLPKNSLNVFQGLSTAGGMCVPVQKLPLAEDEVEDANSHGAGKTLLSKAAAAATIESENDGELDCKQNKPIMQPPPLLRKAAVTIKERNKCAQSKESLNNSPVCSNILESNTSVLNTTVAGFSNCFSTASGKSIEVSEEALHNARKRLQDTSDNSKFIKNSMQSASKHIENSAELVPANSSDSFLSKCGADALCKVNSSENPSNPTVKSAQFISHLHFYTGSGTKVNVSEEYLEIAKKQLSRIPCEYHPLRIFNADVTHLKKNIDHGLEVSCGDESEGSREWLQASANNDLGQEVSLLPRASQEHLSPGSPDSCTKQETEESIIAWLQDEDTDLTSSLGVPLLPGSPSLCARAAPNAHQTTAKRARHNESFSEEPPVKRQLLSESTVGKSAKLLPEPCISRPDDFYGSRRCLPHGTMLRPSVTSPYHDIREWKQGANITDRGWAAAGDKITVSPQGLPNAHSRKPRVFLPPFRVSQREVSSTAQSACALAVPACVPPHTSFLRSRFPGTAGQRPISSEEPQVLGGGDESAGPNLLPKTRDRAAASPPCPAEDAVGSAGWLARLANARMEQELRSSQKRRQMERARPGSLLAVRSAAPSRVPLRVAVGGQAPASHSHEQLLRCGVSAGVMDVQADTAEAFRFHCEQHFSWKMVRRGCGFQLADGGILIPDHTGTAGKEEFYKALLDTPGVDPGLVDAAWAYNHYRWLVWKLAAMEAAFPLYFAGRCLTPEVVLIQLKYRYDIEVDSSKRSAIRKIVERDDTASRTLVLLVSRLTGANMASGSTPAGGPMLELSDGWYKLPALLDAPLAALARQGRIRVGQKLMVHGAELIGAQDACSPLEAPASLMLKICTNGTRRARWDARLGFHRNPGPFLLPMSSLLADGGAVGCVDVVVLRIYPLQWMEKLANGGYMFRSERAEEREARKRSVEQQRVLDSLYARLERNLDQRHEGRDRNKLKKSMVEIQALQDGAELYEAISGSVDPGYVESSLSDEQARTLHNHRQGLADHKRAQMQAELSKALSSLDGSSSGAQRDVCPLWRLRVAGYRDTGRNLHATGTMLSIWRPVLELQGLFKEGLRFRIYHLAASQGRGNLDAGNVQLASSKKTKYQQMQDSDGLLGTVYHPRQAVAFSDLLSPDFWPPYAEVDIVGIVISIQGPTGGGTQTVTLADEHQQLVSVRVWGGLAVAAVEELVRPWAVVAITNLQWRPVGAPRTTPLLFAGELCGFSLNPKERHLRDRHSALRAAILDMKSFVGEVEAKLLGHGVQPGVQHPALVEQPNSAQEKRKKGLSYLNRIPSPPPLSPLITTSTPVARRAFRAPRFVRADYEESMGSSNATLHKDSHAASPRLHTPPVSTPTSQPSSLHCDDAIPKDSVADNGLMMIDTKALLHSQTQSKMCDTYKSAVAETNTSLNAAATYKVKAAVSEGVHSRECNPTLSSPAGSLLPVMEHMASVFPGSPPHRCVQSTEPLPAGGHGVVVQTQSAVARNGDPDPGQN